MEKIKLEGKEESRFKSLIGSLAAETGLYEYQIRQVLMNTIRYIVTELSQGHDIYLTGLGKFWLKKAKAQVSFDPYRKIKKNVGERFIPKFNYGKKAQSFIREEAKNHLK